MSCVYFNQQTSYELRISDWSSDVWSCDLVGGRSANVCRAGRAVFHFDEYRRTVHSHSGTRLETRWLDASGKTKRHDQPKSRPYRQSAQDAPVLAGVVGAYAERNRRHRDRKSVV